MSPCSSNKSRFSLFSCDWGSQIFLEKREEAEYLVSTLHESCKTDVFGTIFQKSDDCSVVETPASSASIKQSGESMARAISSSSGSMESDSSSWMEESDPTREMKVNINEYETANLDPILQVLEEVPYEYNECTRSICDLSITPDGITDVTLDSSVPFEKVLSDCGRFSFRSGNADIILNPWLPSGTTESKTQPVLTTPHEGDLSSLNHVTYDYNRKTSCERNSTFAGSSDGTRYTQQFLNKAQWGFFHGTRSDVHKTTMRTSYGYKRGNFKHLQPNGGSVDLLRAQAFCEYSRIGTEYMLASALIAPMASEQSHFRENWLDAASHDQDDWRCPERDYGHLTDHDFHRQSFEDFYYQEMDDPLRLNDRQFHYLSNSVCNAQALKPQDDNQKATRSWWKGKELLLTLRPDQIAQGTKIEHLRSQFEDFGYKVIIYSLKDKKASYSLEFTDRKEAQRALADPKIGYKLVKKRPLRPSPTCPIQFKALHALRIRTGKALTGRVVGVVKKNELVTVNQVKGRRARLMYIDKEGNKWNRGWVSVHTSEGKPLLERQDKCHDYNR